MATLALPIASTCAGASRAAKARGDASLAQRVAHPRGGLDGRERLLEHVREDL
ncbi:MAG: hypothetical protein H6713_25805 [Myxococcales bacterium]|nr:hypothetical protein [Myxococcales bacterium]